MSTPPEISQIESSRSGTIRVAPSPFDRVAADVILRTSDKVDFFVYKAILTIASDFFETMFSLTQPSPEGSGNPLTEYPIIDLPEDSETIEPLLRLCYPVDDPDIQTLEQVDRVLGAANKYEMLVAVKLLHLIVQRKFVHDHPRQAYVIACRHNLEEAARMAAKTWKRCVAANPNAMDFASTLPGTTWVPEMHGITAGPYYRLLSYLRTDILPDKFCAPSSGALSTDGESPGGESSLFDWKDADVVIRSSDGIDFRVHQFALTTNEGHELLCRAKHVDDLDSLRVLQVDIPTDVLQELLSLCYPTGVTDSRARVLNTRIYGEVVRTAVRYDMKAVVRTMQRSCKEYMKRDPLALFLVAAQFQWSAEAQDAANGLAHSTLDGVYSPQLEITSANRYQALLKYHHLYQNAIMKTFEKHAKCQSGSSYYHANVTQGKWRARWLQTNPSSGKYTRTFPSVLAELHGERSQRTSGFDFDSAMFTTQILEAEVEETVQNIRVELDDPPATYFKML